ncbi:ras-related protein Rab-37-like protein [Cricetulus griseus]|nr:ras-related protein Rab-37-like protein [Cricetulus griseus]
MLSDLPRSRQQNEMCTGFIDGNTYMESEGKFIPGSFSATVGIGFTIWDTAGQERFRSVTHAYYRDAQALLLLYDITNKSSFDNIRAWLTEIHEYAQRDVVVMLLGNKADVSSERVIRSEDGETLAREYGVPFMETSAKTGMNVELAFLAIAKELKYRAGRQPDEPSFQIRDYVESQKKRPSCCSFRELRPRLCTMKKGPNGYGFNLHSDKSKPGQFIRAVDPDSPAEASGLRAQDRIVEVNGVCMEGKQHGDVVSAIKAGGDEAKLLVVDKETDEFFKKCKVIPSQEHLDGPLPEPFTNGEIQKLSSSSIHPPTPARTPTHKGYRILSSLSLPQTPSYLPNGLIGRHISSTGENWST